MNDSLSLRVELFADLMVHIDDPFARREAVFASSGLDDASYRSLVEAWRARFDRDDTGKLASRFADAYAEARAKLHDTSAGHASGDGGAGDPRFLNADAQSFREEAAKVAREPMNESATPPISGEAPMAVEAAMAPSATPPITPAPTFAPLIVMAPIVSTNAERRALFSGTMDISAAIPRESLPFVPQTALASRTAEPPAEPPKPALPTGTSDISGMIPRDLLPFLGGGDVPPAPPPPKPVTMGEPQTPLARPAAFAGTADISAFVPRGALPFSDSGLPPERPMATLPREPEAPSTSGVRRPPQALAGTADISAFIPRPATPFASSAPPPVAASSAPRKRLIRFDPQTGQPLPTPIWVDLPPEPEGQKK